MESIFQFILENISTFKEFRSKKYRTWEFRELGINVRLIFPKDNLLGIWSSKTKSKENLIKIKCLFNYIKTKMQWCNHSSYTKEH